MLSDAKNEYRYDNEGNRVAKGTGNDAVQYFWDHRNRLVKVVTPAETVEYVYDYKNRLVKRNNETFVHDGWQIVMSLKDGAVRDRYLWGAKQDELLCKNDEWILGDHLNTVRDVVKSDGSVVKHLEYNAFGQMLEKTGESDCRFKYTGKFYDDVTELQWNINRWYDPSVGRWISEDPIGFAGKDANLARYVGSNPLSKLDPNGHVTCTLLGRYPQAWVTRVAGAGVGVSVGTNPSVINSKPATEIYCYRTRTWLLQYDCPGSGWGPFKRCPWVENTSEEEYQVLSAIDPASEPDVEVILLGEITIPLPSPVKGPGPGISASGFLTPEDEQRAQNMCNNASYPASTHVPAPTFPDRNCKSTCILPLCFRTKYV